MKFSVCENCKLYYGHKLKYCPGCPNEFKYIELSEQERKALKEQGWESEKKNEYLFRGKVYNNYNDIQAILYEENPEVEAMAKRHGYWLGCRWNNELRMFTPVYVHQSLEIVFNEQVYYRPQGSTVYHKWWKVYKQEGE